MKITKSKLKQIIKEEISELYADYHGEPIEALKLRRQEIKDKLDTTDPKSFGKGDYDEYKRLGQEIGKLEKMHDEGWRFVSDGDTREWLSPEDFRAYEDSVSRGDFTDQEGARMWGDEDEDLAARDARYDRNRFGRRDIYKG